MARTTAYRIGRFNALDPLVIVCHKTDFAEKREGKYLTPSHRCLPNAVSAVAVKKRLGVKLDRAALDNATLEEALGSDPKKSRWYCENMYLIAKNMWESEREARKAYSAEKFAANVMCYKNILNM